MQIRPFTIHRRSASDEDAPPYANKQFVIVCDGLGGNGMSRHCIEEDGEMVMRTSAYLGSRTLSKAVINFFSKEELYDFIWENPEIFFSLLKNHIGEILCTCVQENHLKKSVKGSSVTLLPSTLAMAAFRECQEGIEILSVWAGDSRVYMLSSDFGLQQLSCDDVGGAFDAMKMLGTSNMSNCITGEGVDTFKLNYKYYLIKKEDINLKNLIIFACSDGCFDYLPTPMAFEYLLETSIQACGQENDIDDLANRISDHYSGGILKDDTTIAAAVIDFSDFSEMKEQYAKRSEIVYEKYHADVLKKLQEMEQIQEEVKNNTVPINKELRDLKKILRPIIIDAINSNNVLSQEILQIPCMASYADNSEKEAKITSLKEDIKQLQEQEANVLKELREVYFEESIDARCDELLNSIQLLDGSLVGKAMRAIPDIIFELNDSVKREEQKVEIESFIDSYLNEILSRKDVLKTDTFLCHIKHRMIEDTGEADLKFFTIYVEYLYRDIMAKIMKDRRAQLFEDQAFKLETERFFLNEVNNHFKEIRNMQNNPKSCEKIIEVERIQGEIGKKNAEIQQLSKKKDCSRYVNNLGDQVIIEFLTIKNLKYYFDSKMSERMEEFKKAYDVQNQRKAEIQKLNDEIFDLWLDYKPQYERYLTSNQEGVV